MFCPFCGIDNAIDQKYCRTCGAMMPTSAKPGANPSSTGTRPGASPTSSSTPFVPPQPPDLPRPGKSAPLRETNEMAQRGATRKPDDPFMTRQAFSVPPEALKGKKPRGSTADLTQEDEAEGDASAVEKLYETQVSIEQGPGEAKAGQSAPLKSEYTETADQGILDMSTIQMGSLPFPVPPPSPVPPPPPNLDDMKTTAMSAVPKAPPAGLKYEDSLPTVKTPQAPPREEQLRLLKEMKESADLYGVADTATKKPLEQTLDRTLDQTLTGGSPEKAQFSSTLETGLAKDSLQSPEEEVAPHTLVMEALPLRDDPLPGDSSEETDKFGSTEAFSYPTEAFSYPAANPPSEPPSSEMDTLIITPPPPAPSFDATIDFHLPSSSTKAAVPPPPPPIQVEDAFKTLLVPQQPPPDQRQSPADPFKTVPMSAVKPESVQRPAAEPAQSQTAAAPQTLLPPSQAVSPSKKMTAKTEPVTEEEIEERAAIEAARPEIPAPDRSRRLLAVVVVAAVALFIVGSIVLMFALRSWRSASATRTVKTGPQPGTKTGNEPAPPANMVLVPAGAYVIGSNEGDKYSSPEQKVLLPAFYIDAYEVTNADYKLFCDATGRSYPKNPDWDNNYFLGRPTYPVVNVSWSDADAYAKQAGKRLPTEEEWEAAASGKDHLLYPWGNEWVEKRANTAEYGAKSVLAVGVFNDGKSPVGALDMCGNVWEWTSSVAQPYPGSTEQLHFDQPGGQYRIVRGGSFKEKFKFSTTRFRYWFLAGESDPTLGFRCAKDAQ